MADRMPMEYQMAGGTSSELRGELVEAAFHAHARPTMPMCLQTGQPGEGVGSQWRRARVMGRVVVNAGGEGRGIAVGIS